MWQESTHLEFHFSLLSQLFAFSLFLQSVSRELNLRNLFIPHLDNFKHVSQFTGNNEQTIWLVLHRQIFVFTYLKERDVSVCACVHDANLPPKCRGRRVGQKWINYFEMFLDSIAIGKEANLELTKMFLKQVAHNAMWGNLLNEVIMWAWYKHCNFCVSMACGSQLWAWAMHFLPFLHGEVLPGITIFASYK